MEEEGRKMSTKTSKIVYSKEIQEDIITSILKEPCLGMVGKILKLRKNPILNQKFVCEYLLSKKYIDLVTLFSNPAQLKKLVPPAHSASEWEKNELVYYNVEFIVQTMEKMFGGKALTDNFLSEEANKFLRFHTQDYNAKFKDSYWENLNSERDFDEFCWLLYSYKDSKHIKSTVNAVVFFLLKLCFAKKYLIKPEWPFELIVCGKKKEAIPAFTLINRLQIKGLIIVLDKTEKSQGDACAQMIAKGIAAAQQNDWKYEWPTYMVSCRGLDIEFYKAIFGKIFLDNVREGYDSTEKTPIYKLACPLDIMQELRKILRIFHALKEEFKERK